MTQPTEKNARVYRAYPYKCGKSKYSVDFHDGVSKHKDGSPFYALAMFKNKKQLKKFVDELVSQGYKEEGISRAWTL